MIVLYSLFFILNYGFWIWIPFPDVMKDLDNGKVLSYV